ncbi:MAG TPA: tryptophan synthase subunit alpha [Candidatus Anoxymicrobiaceae bacterium]
MGAARLGEMFDSLSGERAALIAYATGYYPDRETSERIVARMLECGADAVEIGIPFSDPVMDGPVIQNASRVGLQAGATPDGVFEMTASLRRATDRPLMAMTYYNLVLRRGLERFADDAAAAGLDALVVPDLPAEEMGPLKEACDAAGLATVAFCSRTTSAERMARASSMASGFLYCVSVLGTTGARNSLDEGLPAFLESVRANTDRPLAVGLGISTPEQCAEVGRMADGVIVGSSLVRAVGQGDDDLSRLADLVSGMASALRQ